MREPDPLRWKALVLLCAVDLMVILDSQIVIVALPTLQRDLGFGEDDVGWVLSAYLLAFGGLLMLGGRTGDLLGRRRMFLAGTALFAVASLACGLATTPGFLIAARVVHGVSAALMAPTALSILVTTFDDEGERNTALAAWGAVGGVGATVALLVGGVLTDAFGMRNSLMLTGVLLIIPTILLTFMVKESFDRPATDRAGAKAKGGQGSALSLLVIPGFAVALAILFVARFTDRAVTPILPLYLIQLETPEATLATITGLVVAAGALAATCSSVAYGRWARPENTRRLLIIALAGGAICSVLLALVSDWVQVMVVRTLLGLLAGGTISLAYTMGARLGPSDRSSMTLSVLASCGMLGSASSPILAGIISQASLRIVFLATGAAYLLAVVLAVIPTLRSQKSDVRSQESGDAVPS
jgi:MFS family permease